MTSLRWHNGIDVLVSLLGEDEEIELGLEHEASVCSRYNIEFLALPVPDLGEPIDSDAFIQSVHRLAVSARGGRSIAVHCRQSVGRSGLLAVSIVLASGLPLDSALDVVSRARVCGSLRRTSKSTGCGESCSVVWTAIAGQLGLLFANALRRLFRLL